VLASPVVMAAAAKMANLMLKLKSCDVQTKKKMYV
jgi:hypothetical protein